MTSMVAKYVALFLGGGLGVRRVAIQFPYLIWTQTFMLSEKCVEQVTFSGVDSCLLPGGKAPAPDVTMIRNKQPRLTENE